jgi:hypothetical protein
MTIVASNDPQILSVEVTDDLITAHLADGRTISVPLVWSWRLANATPEQRQHFEIIGTGQGVHWPDIDEDISAIGMLTGTPAPRPKQKVSRSKKYNALTGAQVTCQELCRAKRTEIKSKVGVPYPYRTERPR